MSFEAERILEGLENKTQITKEKKLDAYFLFINDCDEIQITEPLRIYERFTIFEAIVVLKVFIAMQIVRRQRGLWRQFEVSIAIDRLLNCKGNQQKYLYIESKLIRSSGIAKANGIFEF